MSSAGAWLFSKNETPTNMLLFSAGRAVFLEYLRSEYSEENILFWLACEELKQEGNQTEVEEKARSIYEEYISMLSPKEVKNAKTPNNKNR